MLAKSYPTDVFAQGQAVLEAWRSFDPQVKIGSLALEAFESEMAKATSNQALMNKLEAQLTDARNQRDAISSELWDLIKRVRTGVKSLYGDDSSQYEMVGGTRLSERKPVARKKVTS
jgi:uncharacterized alpha-E superfamily protein